MRFEIVLSPESIRAFRRLSAYDRAMVRDALETHLRFEPTKISRSRIKRLRGLIRPQFRLRVDDIRVFYDVTDKEVQVLVIISKGEAQAWLEAEGEAEP
jgi:mRNA interferase RelE/StbE